MHLTCLPLHLCLSSCFVMDCHFLWKGPTCFLFIALHKLWCYHQRDVSACAVICLVTRKVCPFIVSLENYCMEHLLMLTYAFHFATFLLCHQFAIILCWERVLIEVFNCWFLIGTACHTNFGFSRLLFNLFTCAWLSAVRQNEPATKGWAIGSWNHSAPQNNPVSPLDNK